jgi:signal transduction histidine kinase
MTAVEERNRIARDIHDSLGHALVALNVQLGAALRLWQQDPQNSYPFLVEAQKLGTAALGSVRQSVAAIRSDPFAGELLERAIANLAQDCQATTGIVPTCEIDLSYPATNSVHQTVYRLVQESLTNICKHAEATAIQIQIQTSPDEFVVMVQDNGKGFCVEEQPVGFGLQGMQERVMALAGQLDIRSEPGGGCQVMAKFPNRGTA